MFPGMFGGQPEPLPEYKADRLFWSRLSRLGVFIASCTLLGYAVRHIEARAGDVMLDKVLEH